MSQLPDRASRRRQKRELGKKIAQEIEPGANVNVNISHARAELFSSQLPSAQELRELNEVIPDGADRMLKLLENQSSHRQFIEKRAINGDTVRANLGLIAGFIVAIYGLYISYDLIRTGHQLAGASVGAVDLIGLVTVFVYGSVSRRNERQLKTDIRAKAANERKQ